ncbi:unnamed protein product, partial [Medioppia subpectinata]
KNSQLSFRPLDRDSSASNRAQPTIQFLKIYQNLCIPICASFGIPGRFCPDTSPAQTSPGHDSCASDLQQQQVSNCVQNGINNGAQIVNILRSCSPGPDISCNRQQRPRTNRCLIQRTVNRRNLMNRRLQRCFRTTVSLATIDCLTNKYRILRTLLPIPPGPPGSVVTSN